MKITYSNDLFILDLHSKDKYPIDFYPEIQDLSEILTNTWVNLSWFNAVGVVLWIKYPEKAIFSKEGDNVFDIPSSKDYPIVLGYCQQVKGKSGHVNFTLSIDHGDKSVFMECKLRWQEPFFVLLTKANVFKA